MTEHLRNRLVSGIYYSEAKKRFRIEKDESLTFDKVLQITLQVEMAIKDMEGAQQLEDVNFIKKVKINSIEQLKSTIGTTSINPAGGRTVKGKAITVSITDEQ